MRRDARTPEEAPQENDELELEGDDEEEEKGSSGQRRYLTRSGAERMHKELLRLLNEERPKVTAEVSAAAQGDRSENAEYIYGKKRLREIDRRIRFLTKRLDAATIVQPSEQTDTERVYFGATVTLEDEDGTRVTYQIVGSDEIDTAGGRISVESPIARALLRKKVGDSVEVIRPRGEIEYTIVQIRYV
ncbi:transcription elongation factor GreB [Archangium sp.]|uniref:transcription elongation factor GreB n=1 Tax=Archangium sp. TaxID=1872627 RepID=UPI00286D092A|nr:transcription elongation factor GreB [Archangium sp.]